MTCTNCGTRLVCHMSEYKGDFKNKLQWQNSDSTAHYSTKDGKNFSCNVLNEIELKPNDEFLNKKQEEIKNQTESKVKLTDQQLIAIHDQIDTLLIIEKIVTARLQGVSDELPNPAKVGMYMKFLWDKLEEKN